MCVCVCCVSVSVCINKIRHEIIHQEYTCKKKKTPINQHILFVTVGTAVLVFKMTFLGLFFYYFMSNIVYIYIYIYNIYIYIYIIELP